MPRRPKLLPPPTCACGAPKVRRRRGTGSVSLRRDGRHQAVPPSLKGVRSGAAYFPADQYGHAAALDWLDRFNAGPDAPQATGTDEPLGEYLRRWRERSTPLWRSKTPTTYAGRLKLAAPLDGVPLCELTTEHFRDLFGLLLKSGKAIRTLQSLRMILRQALEELVPDVLGANPIRRTKLPKLPARQDAEPKAWGRQDAERFLRAAEGTRLYALWRLALGTGMRLGELRALRWEDLDLDAATVRVRRSANSRRFEQAIQPDKSRRGRLVDLPAPAVAALRAHRAGQSTVSGWVFDNGSGRMPWSEYVVREEFRRVRASAGVAPITIHGTRHTAASLMLADGVPLPRLAQILGHSSGAVTLQVYAWAMPADRRAGAESMERLLP